VSPYRRYFHNRKDIGGELVRDGDILPNPWVREAPSCPEGHPPEDVYLWASLPEDGLGKWFCSPCGRRFS
jgi:hypothetical protein